MVTWRAVKVFCLLLAILPKSANCQLLGAGTGVASCRAFPYRAEKVDWEVCPVEVSCCNEYGFCRTREEWKSLKFRDCNGVSNDIALPDSVLQLENSVGGQAGDGLGAKTDFDRNNIGSVNRGPGSASSPSYAQTKGYFGPSDNGGTSLIKNNQGLNGGGRGSGQGQGLPFNSRESSIDNNQGLIGGGSGSSQGINGGGSGNSQGQGFPHNSLGTSNSNNQGLNGGGSGTSQGQGSPGNSRGVFNNNNEALNGEGRATSQGQGFPRNTSGTSNNSNNQGINGGGRGSSQGQGLSGNSRGTSNSNKQELQEGSSEGNTFQPSDIFPLEGYMHKGGYPSMLNEENCPNYPYCYWNPY
eukprot:GFUD01029392.1.p1 GENE.GFUD01029392.1~~GFUD01029392.1.p1  ORF type:complete len:365 (+),score=88.47 GFUD01029392.1:32-1096(+)